MNYQNHQTIQNWSNVLYDFTDNLVEHPSNTNGEIFNGFLHHSPQLDNSLIAVFDGEIQNSHEDKPYANDPSEDLLKRTANNCKKYIPNQKKKNPSQIQTFLQRVSPQTIEKANLQISVSEGFDFIKGSDSPKGWRQRKQRKQHIYSKNYREKKKQQLKIMEEENTFLNKKIVQLQLRMRQTQNELNKLKHSFQQEKKSLMELNHIWISKIRELLNSSSKTEEDLYKEFSNSYDEYGFAGRQKIEKLQYHMNEFLENVLKDSQKYMALTAINNIGLLGKSPENDYPETNYTIFEIIEYDQQKIETVRKFLRPYLKPSMERIQKSCQKLYQNFQHVFTQIYQAHQYLKASKNKDFLTIKQRLQMENWFQQNKYSKELRKLRADWQNSLKNTEKDQNFELMRKKISTREQ